MVNDSGNCCSIRYKKQSVESVLLKTSNFCFLFFFIDKLNHHNWLLILSIISKKVRRSNLVSFIDRTLICWSFSIAWRPITKWFGTSGRRVERREYAPMGLSVLPNEQLIQWQCSSSFSYELRLTFRFSEKKSFRYN